MAELERRRGGGASPYSTGGGGTRFEHKVGALFLARLLTAEPVVELGGWVPDRVSFQQSPSSDVDDLVVTAPAAGGRASLRVDIAVRRSPNFVRSHQTTGELVAALMRADLDAEQGHDLLVERRLAVAVSGPQAHTQELAELAAIARGQTDSDRFFELVRTPGKFSSRRRLEHLLDMVAVATEELGSQHTGTAERRTWSLLQRLWIIHARLETGHEEDWTRLAADLRSVTVSQSLDEGHALRDRLEQVSADLAVNAGSVDRTRLRRMLHGRLRMGDLGAPAGWTRLLAVDENARASVARALAADHGDEVRLPRLSVRESLAAALAAAAAAGGHLMVTGESGVGKSAMVLDAVEPDRLDDDTQSVAVNLRHLPRTQLELLALLGCRLETMLDELTAPRRILVIDGVEAVAEGREEVFASCVRAAEVVGATVVAITAADGAGVVKEVMRGAGSEPSEFQVPGLEDDELTIVADRFPTLIRLLNEPRARELLRRPIVVDLLTRSGDPGLPLSESQALEHIWRHLVLNLGRRDAGEPGAREGVMLLLAAYAVRGGSADDVLARLDQTAVEGLRRSGVLLPASGLAWERMPAFKHDLLRAYSVARLLLADRDPAAALLETGAPRWTLPAARLACEMALAAPDHPSSPRAERFRALQAGFDDVASLAGRRWSDVPTEAMLVAPDAGELLESAWSVLTDRDATGLTRLLRVLDVRHTRSGTADAVIADPVVARLATADVPRGLREAADKLISGWLSALIAESAPAGRSTRVVLRQDILRRCAEKRRALDEQEAAALAAEMAERPPGQVDADVERSRQLPRLGSILGGRRRRQRPSTRRSYTWITDQQITHLAMLGPDLADEGEAILRKIAEDDPQSLDNAVEPFFAGHSLASHDPGLLADLAAAYYIESELDEDDESDGDEWGWSFGMREEGIRDHQPELGLPLSHWAKGPFLALFRADYTQGVALLNRMLDRGARAHARSLRELHQGMPGEGDDVGGAGPTLSITGEPRQFAGNPQVWCWYRGTGHGPYPCLSALQALELVTEELISIGIPVDALVTTMLHNANNLAMPALALAVLVRHLDAAGDLVDPFLVEPDVWQLEFSRVVNESAGPAVVVPGVNQERRLWSLREVSMMLALSADEDRVAGLKTLGEQLLANALTQVGDDSTVDAREHLAAVRSWAASLNRDAYEVRQQDDHLTVKQMDDPDVEQILGPTNADLVRTSNALGLAARHANVRDNGGGPPLLTDDELATDVALARSLLLDPPSARAFTAEGPVAVAASVLELVLTGRATCTDDDLLWSARVLLQIARHSTSRRPADYDASFFSHSPMNSAARALPLFLLPPAEGLRSALGLLGAEGAALLVELSRAVGANGAEEARLAYARALDHVWVSPCDWRHLDERCHHQIAFDLVTDSLLYTTLGPWDQHGQRRPLIRLEPPEATALDVVPGKDIVVRRLTPSLRSAGAAAASAACCRDAARQVLRPLLAAHQRGMLEHRHGYHHSRSDSLVAARAALWQARDGRDEVVLDYLRTYLSNARLLAEGLQAVAAAAEERADAAEHAQRLWPDVMDLVLDAAVVDPTIFTLRTWGDYAEAALLPTPAAQWGYLTIESAESRPWRRPLAWAPQVERWLATITNGREASRMSIDNLVSAVRELDVADQADQGLRWLEWAVASGGQACASTFMLPGWLRERRLDLAPGEQTARWQRVVDQLVVSGDARVADLAD